MRCKNPFKSKEKNNVVHNYATFFNLSSPSLKGKQSIEGPLERNTE
jgi:hypothetical protein